MATTSVRQPDLANRIRRASTQGLRQPGTGAEPPPIPSAGVPSPSAWEALRKAQAKAKPPAEASPRHLLDVVRQKQLHVEEHTTFWTAARKGEMRALERMLNKGQDPNEQDLNGVSALSWTVFGGHTHLLRFLIRRGADPSQPDLHTGRTPLHYTSIRGDKLDCARALLKAGADINARSAKLGTPLEWARKNGAEEVVKLLEKAQAG